MYRDLINKLKIKGVGFDKGLTGEEILKIENIYQIIFPEELKDFYKRALPITDGFYNWRKFSLENINYIKNTMTSFKNDILKYSDEIDWCLSWGKEPNDITMRRNYISSAVKKAPTMIPIFKHRALAAINIKNNPVFSIMGTDIICYGKNITEYFENEFHIKEKHFSTPNKFGYVPFWSDLL